MQPFLARLGESLRYLRKVQNLRQKEVAQRAGITRPMLSAYERGHILPSLPVLDRVLTSLNCDFHELSRTTLNLETSEARVSLDETAALLVDPWLPPARQPHSACPTLHQLAEYLMDPHLALHVDHWLHGCATCAQHFRLLERWSQSLHYPDYRVAALEYPRARHMWRELIGVPISKTERYLEDPRFHFWGFCTRLCAESHQALFTSVTRGVWLAEFAVGLSERLSGYPRNLLADLRALTLAALANAWRVSRDLQLAEKHFQRAFEVLHSKGLVRAVLLDLLASLRIDQRRLTEAEELLQEALALAQAHANEHLTGQSYIKLSLVATCRDDLQAAVAALTSAQGYIDHTRDPFEHATCQHNLVRYLAESGQFEEAQARIPMVREQWLTLGHYRNLARLEWVEARILLGLGKRENALHQLQEVLASMGEDSYSAALIHLDMAVVLAEQKLPFEAQLETGRSLLANHDLPTAQPALNYLDVLVQAQHPADNTPDALRQVIRYFDRLRQRPELEFSPKP